MKRIAFAVDCADDEADRIQKRIESFLKTIKLEYRLNAIDVIAVSRSID